MTDCRTGYVPKPSAPPNWIITAKQLYSGTALPRLAALLAAAELSREASRIGYGEEFSRRTVAWEKALAKLTEATTGPPTNIIDLGLTPDLCTAGRPKNVPSPENITPEFVASGGLSLGLTELIKQSYFDQYCECRPLDPDDACPCVPYRLSWGVTSQEPANIPANPSPEAVLLGGFSGLQIRTDITTGYYVYGHQYGIGCLDYDQTDLPFFAVLAVPPEEFNLWKCVFADMRLENPDDFKGCDRPPVPPPDPPYQPGYPGLGPWWTPEPVEPGQPWPLPPPKIPFPEGPDVPIDFICPPCEEPDMYYWEKEPLSGGWVEAYSGIPPVEGVDVVMDTATVAFMVTYDIGEAKADQTLRNFKRSLSTPTAATTFINVARVYPLAGGKAIDSVELSAPETVIAFDIIHRKDTKAVRIMPKSIAVTMKVFVNPCRWVQKKFDRL